MPYIQMIVSSVKSENIPNFYYLHFYILLSWSSVQKSMKAYFRWEWKCYQVLEMKKNRNNVNGIHPDLLKQK